MGRLRRPGGRWRLLVHEWIGKQPDSPVLYGTAHHVSSAPGEDGEHRRHHHLPGTEFDELVVGSWLHVEQMDAGVWWMNCGGVTLTVRVDRDGRPQRVSVSGPDDDAAREDGVEYELTWSMPPETPALPEEETT
ncbi:hypothetical protein ACFOY2_05170 [Nonomuraea purpurea]|uniref:Uncharacterized protein n=1 Tax=Nonomuraea purpurea TaxID=1849276 RepID=A0ABV8FY16_9ACTN